MENSEIKDKLENLEILLSSFIQTANDPKKRAEDSELFKKAIEGINSTQKEIEGLISKEKHLIENFKPVVEVKNYSINVKEPLYWIGGAIVVMLICFVISFSLYQSKEKFENESAVKDWNYMKYKYLVLFGDYQTRSSLKEFDKDYEKNWKKYDQQIIQREKELQEAAMAAKEAEIKAAEAKKLKQRADSLRNK